MANEKPNGAAGPNGKYNRHIAYKAKKKEKAENGRIYTLDEIRGLAVFCMVFYHMFYCMSAFFDISAGEQLFNFFMPVQPFFAMIFIFISGISSRLSHNNTARGVKLFIIALGVTVVTAVILPLKDFKGAEIYFGILHCLAVSMLIFSGLRKLLDNLPIVVGIIIFLTLYILTYNIESGVIGIEGFFSFNLPDVFFKSDYFMPLGFHTNNFSSADYFPIIPNLFLFLSGTYVGVYAEAKAFPKFTYERRSALLSFLGRHALIIYLAHMPIIYGALMLIESFI